MFEKSAAANDGHTVAMTALIVMFLALAVAVYAHRRSSPEGGSVPEGGPELQGYSPYREPASAAAVTQTDNVVQVTTSTQSSAAASESVGLQTNKVVQASTPTQTSALRTCSTATQTVEEHDNRPDCQTPATSQRNRQRPPLDLTAATTATPRRRERQTQRSREYRERRERQSRAAAAAPSRTWLAWFAAMGFALELRRRARCRRTVLLRCTFVMQPHCRRFVDKLRAGRRLRALKLLETRPVAMPYDVGYEASTESFFFRSTQGVLQREHPGSGEIPHRLSCPSHSRDGMQQQPLSPPASSPIVLRAEVRGGWCYYDTALGETSWFSPEQSTELRDLPLKEWRLPDSLPPRLDSSIGMNCLKLTGWTAFFRDVAHEVCLMNLTTGAVRDGPWISLRTSTGCVYFANLVSRETRWLPPHLWMEGWRCRRPSTGVYMGPHPHGHVDEWRSLHEGLPHLGTTGRESVEGGAPYMHEHGLPSYPPDEDDTPLTYPLKLYTCCYRSGQLADAAATEPTQGPREDLVIEVPPLIGQAPVGGNSDASSTCSLATADTYYVSLEEASRACGIIERSWIWYAVEILGSDTCVTAMNAEDNELYITPPPYRFMVHVSELYEFVSLDTDGMHLLDDELLRAYTFPK